MVLIQEPVTHSSFDHHWISVKKASVDTTVWATVRCSVMLHSVQDILKDLQCQSKHVDMILIKKELHARFLTVSVILCCSFSR